MKILDFYRSFAVNQGGPLSEVEAAYSVARTMCTLEIVPEVRRLLAGSPMDREEAHRIFKGIFNIAYDMHYQEKDEEKRSMLFEVMKRICQLKVAVDRMIEEISQA